MIKKSIAALWICASLISCGKDDLNSPVKTQLLMEMEAQQNVSGEKLVVTGARFMLQELGFDGYRENGENYFFTKSFADTLSISFTKDSPATVLNFEMPQGVYNRIDIGLKLAAGRESVLAAPIIDNSAIRGGIQIWGIYHSFSGATIPFLFVYTADDEYEFRAKAQDGSQQFVLKDEQHYQARLRFNPDQWMDLINPRMLQSAQLAVVNGVSTIILSKTQNEHIYNLLASRIDKSATLLFQ